MHTRENIACIMVIKSKKFQLKESHFSSNNKLCNQYECAFWVFKLNAHMYRRRTSILPEIRVLAPSLERGLDDSWPQISQSPEIPESPSSLTNSPHIYRSHDDITSESSRYIWVYSNGAPTWNTTTTALNLFSTRTNTSSTITICKFYRIL